MIVLRNKEFARRDYANLSAEEAENLKQYRSSLAAKIKEVRNTKEFPSYFDGRDRSMRLSHSTELPGYKGTSHHYFINDGGNANWAYQTKNPTGIVEANNSFRKTASEGLLKDAKKLSANYKQSLIKDRPAITKSRMWLKRLFRK